MCDSPQRPINFHVVELHRAKLEEVDTEDLQIEVDKAEASGLSLEELHAMRLILDARGLHKYRPQETPHTRMSDEPLAKSSTKKVGVPTSPCTHCGSAAIIPSVSVSQSAEAGNTGLEYKGWGIFVGCEPLLADVCSRCGTVNRLHVRNTDHNWIRR